MLRFRPSIQRIDGYVPGEQPQDAGWIKLNTNENPYPPSPRVIEAIEHAARGRLNVYPDPVGTRFRRAAGEMFGLDADWILPANGSDENLTIVVRSFADAGELVTFPYPSYILYETLADIQGARHERLLLNADWSWDVDRVRPTVEQSRIVFVPNPNSPSGNSWSHDTIEQLVPPDGALVLDEAYGDFPAEPHRAQILQREVGRQIIITRTLSKSYSLAGLRFGFAIAHPDVIAGMRKVKDSYNCDTLALAAATAAIEDQDWMLGNAAKIRATRTRLTSELRSLGFDAVDSDANFVWTTHPERSHREVFEALKDQKILVRFMTFPGVLGGGTLDGLRITVGTDEEIDRFLEVLRTIVA
ncbi:MAG: histidinol-phosphate transaminase [Planctomycetota bacterium]|jgi:histidinol-phosphate aminotransferase